MTKILKAITSAALYVKDLAVSAWTYMKGIAASVKAEKAVKVAKKVTKAAAAAAEGKATAPQVEVVTPEEPTQETTATNETAETFDATSELKGALRTFGIVATGMVLTYFTVTNFPLTVLYAMMFYMTYKAYTWIGERIV